MEDRDFNEVGLRVMMEQARAYRVDTIPRRWVIETNHRGENWEVIVEPDESERLLVIIKAYPTGGSS